MKNVLIMVRLTRPYLWDDLQGLTQNFIWSYLDVRPSTMSRIVHVIGSNIAIESLEWRHTDFYRSVA